MKIAFFMDSKGLSTARHCLRPEDASLSNKLLKF